VPTIFRKTIADIFHENSAGGGGNTKERRTKIQDKNTKLNDERVRRLQEEEKAKWEKKASQPSQPPDDNGIHPSRRGIVPRS
jgi:nucleolar protein 6